MYETLNQVLNSARELGLDSQEFRQVGPTRWQDILSRILRTFTKTHVHNVLFLWEWIKSPHVSFQTKNGLELIRSMVDPKTRVWVLLEDTQRTKKTGNYWVFEGGFG